MKITTFLVGAATFIILLIIVLVWADLFNTASFLALVLPFTGLGVSIAYLNFAFSKERQETANKKSFDYCWAGMNRTLSRMPGADSLSWDGGFGRKSDVRTYSIGSTQKEFRSFYAYSSRAKQTIVVIWNITDEDVARYDANPSRDVLEDPFYEFKPFERGQGLDELRQLDRYGRPYRRTSINVGRGAASDLRSNEFIDAALKGEGRDDKQQG